MARLEPEQADLTVGAGTKPDRETDQNRISSSRRCNWLVTGALKPNVKRRPQDTALLESNRSGVLRQRSSCLRSACGRGTCTRFKSYSHQVPWPYAENSGGLEAEPPRTPPESRWTCGTAPCWKTTHGSVQRPFQACLICNSPCAAPAGSTTTKPSILRVGTTRSPPPPGRRSPSYTIQT